MISSSMKPFGHCARFLDNGVERTQYTNDRRHYERLVASHGHLSGLRIEPVILSKQQEDRLAEIARAGLGPHDASIYVQYGTTESEDSGYYSADLLTLYRQDQVAPRIQAQRIAAEGAGVVLNGIRYSGDASNRQAMQEALTAAADGDLDSFSSWKCSDGRYHSNHPVSEVESALREIGNRRSALIELEGQYVARAAAGEVDVEALEWVTEFD